MVYSDGSKPPDDAGAQGGFSGYAAKRDTVSDASPATAFSEASERLREVRDYASLYIQARIDKIKVSLRNLAVLTVLGIIGLLAGGAIVVTAAVLLCSGIAEGLTVLFGNRMWLGDLVTAILIFGAIGGGVYMAMARLTKTSKERTVNAYEQRKRQQCADHGTDVHERAEQARTGQ